MKNRPETVPGDPRSSSEATGEQKSRKISGTVDFGRPRGRPGDPKFIEKCIKKTMKKRFLPKTIFFRNLSAFRASRRRFSSILGPKMDAQTIIF